MNAEIPAVPALEIGGSHVSAALVDPQRWRVIDGTQARLTVDSNSGAGRLIERFLSAAASLPTVPLRDARCWGVAVPDPFDYEIGVALFEGVGKFESLHGTDLRAVLLESITPRPHSVVFVNDADAFALGEWRRVGGAAARRCVGVTLGTGVGSGWVVDGEIVDPGLPPGGRIHRLDLDGVPLENLISRRAIRRAYADATGDIDADVRDIAARARGGERVAREVLHRAFAALGRLLGPCLESFAADVLAIGGSMAASWDVFAPSFLEGLSASGVRPPPIRLAPDAEHAALLGAAACALSRRPAISPSTR